MRAALFSVGLTLVTWPGMAQTWEEVGAMFAERCTLCHSGEFAPLGLRLDSYADALAGGENGPVLIPGDAAASPLYQRLTGDIEPRMPMTGPPFLSEAEIAEVAAWIDAGLPEGEAPPPAPARTPLPVATDDVHFGDVAPIFLQRCVRCHSEGSILGAPPEGLILTSRAAILAGGERIVVVPGNATLSPIWRHVAGIETPRMPFDGPPFLSDPEIALIAAWIDAGARDDEGGAARMPVGGSLRVEGILTAQGELDGARFTLAPGARIEDAPRIGGRYELRGTVGEDGTVTVHRLRAR